MVSRESIATPMPGMSTVSLSGVSDVSTTAGSGTHTRTWSTWNVETLPELYFVSK